MTRIVLLLACLLASAAPLLADVSSGAANPAVSDTRTPGVALAEGITEITGVAISPLLGISAVGSWTWYHTAPEDRAALAWYCQPWLWGSAFVLLALCFLKDSLGAATPGLLKKPFDLVELVENKASALVASVGFVPLVAAEIARAMKPVEVPTAMIHGDMVALINPAWVTVPLAVLGFGLVWLCSHAVNVLIILSPFSSIDTLLKMGRTAMLLVVVIAYAISPWLGAALCLLILAVAIWMAPAAMRLLIFGTRFAGDLVFSGRGKSRARIDQPHVFTLGSIEGLPSRTGGWLVKSGDGGVEFHYRRFVFGPERTIKLPAGRHDIAKGVLMPVLVRVDDHAESKVLVMLPRYRGREEEIRAVFGLAAVRDHAWARGWSSMKEWLRGMTKRRVAS